MSVLSELLSQVSHKMSLFHLPNLFLKHFNNAVKQDKTKSVFSEDEEGHNSITRIFMITTYIECRWLNETEWR